MANVATSPCSRELYPAATTLPGCPCCSLCPLSASSPPVVIIWRTEISARPCIIRSTLRTATERAACCCWNRRWRRQMHFVLRSVPCLHWRRWRYGLDGLIVRAHCVSCRRARRRRRCARRTRHRDRPACCSSLRGGRTRCQSCIIPPIPTVRLFAHRANAAIAPSPIALTFASSCLPLCGSLLLIQSSERDMSPILMHLDLYRYRRACHTVITVPSLPATASSPRR